MEDSNKYRQFDELSKSQKLKVAREEHRDLVSFYAKTRKQERKCYRFYAGDQYTREEKKHLEMAGRPALVGNLVKPTVELVKGVNDMNRVEAKAEATEPGDGFLADILNDCYEKVRNLSKIQDQEDDCFENNIICGSGYLAVDVAPDPKRPGEIRIPVVSIPTGEILEDPDGRYIFWRKWLSLEDFAIDYPDFVGDLDDILAGESSGDLGIIELDEDWGGGDTPVDEDYSNILDDGYYDKSKGMVKVIHKEYWTPYDRYYGVNPQTGEIEEFSKEKLPILKKLIPDFRYEVVKDKKVKWFQFIGHKVLYDGDSPIPFDGFSIVSEHAYKDKSSDRVRYFGIVKDMIDPQREANKRWSQTLNLYLKQSQGGYFVEKTAIEDADQWRDTIDAPGQDTVVADGAIAQGKIKEKRIPELPTGALQMNEFAQELMKKISGVNPDLLGMDRGRQDPGIVVRLRQQQGLVLLNNLFTNHRRAIEDLAERIYAIIMKYMPESQIRRILGGGKKYIFRGNLVVNKESGTIAPLRDLKNLKYNIDVRDAPTNMTKTMAQLGIFMEMMSKGFPVDPEAIINKLDIAEDEKKRWIEYVKNAQQGQQEAAQEKMKSEVAKLQLQAQKVAGDQEIQKQKIVQQGLADTRKFDIEIAKLDTKAREIVLGLVERLSQGQGV